MSFTPTLDRRGLLAGAATLAAGAFAGSFAGRAFAQGAEMPSIESYVHGDPDAPVKLIEYASLTCPHCANFHVTTRLSKREISQARRAVATIRFRHLTDSCTSA